MNEIENEEQSFIPNLITGDTKIEENKETGYLQEFEEEEDKINPRDRKMVKGIVNEMEDLQFNSKENFAVYMKSIEEKLYEKLSEDNPKMRDVRKRGTVDEGEKKRGTVDDGEKKRGSKRNRSECAFPRMMKTRSYGELPPRTPSPRSATPKRKRNPADYIYADYANMVGNIVGNMHYNNYHNRDMMMGMGYPPPQMYPPQTPAFMGGLWTMGNMKRGNRNVNSSIPSFIPGTSNRREMFGYGKSMRHNPLNMNSAMLSKSPDPMGTNQHLYDENESGGKFSDIHANARLHYENIQRREPQEGERVIEDMPHSYIPYNRMGIGYPQNQGFHNNSNYYSGNGIYYKYPPEHLYIPALMQLGGVEDTISPLAKSLRENEMFNTKDKYYPYTMSYGGGKRITDFREEDSYSSSSYSDQEENEENENVNVPTQKLSFISQVRSTYTPLQPDRKGSGRQSTTTNLDDSATLKDSRSLRSHKENLFQSYSKPPVYEPKSQLYNPQGTNPSGYYPQGNELNLSNFNLGSLAHP